MPLSRTGIFAAICLALAVHCAVDPFNHCAISNFPDFRAFKVDIPCLSEMLLDKDSENLLQKSEIKFLNQVQGPESMAFDPSGRGPYTGIANKRTQQTMPAGHREEQSEAHAPQSEKPDLKEFLFRLIGKSSGQI